MCQFHMYSGIPPRTEAAAVMRVSIDQFKRNVDASLRGRAVDGVPFDRNPSIKG
jgi:hypothetical protein